MGQREFDFRRADQLALVERWDCPRVPGVSPTACKSVLRAIDGFGRGREAWPSEATLAQTAGCSIRTVKRVVKALAALSILIVERRGTNTVNHYRIVWTELALLAPERSATDSERSATVSERSATVSLTKCHGVTNEVPPWPPETTRNDNETTTTDPLVVVVQNLGVVKAEKATAAARARGLDDTAIRQLCETFAALPAPDRVPGKLWNWLTTEGSFQRSEQPKRFGRGDGLSRDDSRREMLRFQIVRQSRRAGFGENEIQQQLAAAGIEF